MSAPPDRPSWLTCPACGKRAFASRAAARSYARVSFPGRRLRTYPCGTGWHLTSYNARKAAAWKDWRSRPAGKKAAA